MAPDHRAVKGRVRGGEENRKGHKRVESTDAIFEMTWAPDGRATFQYGEPQGKGAHVVWRRIGTHKAFRSP